MRYEWKCGGEDEEVTTRIFGWKSVPPDFYLQHQNVTYFLIWRQDFELVKMISYWIRVDPTFSKCCPYKKVTWKYRKENTM